MSKKKSSISEKSNTKLPLQNRDLPATVGQLDEVRSELKADIRALDHKIDKVDHKVDALHSEMSARFSEVNSRFSEVNSRFSELKSDVEKVLSAVHRSQALLEDQYKDNKIVLDGHKQVNERMDRIDRQRALVRVADHL